MADGERRRRARTHLAAPFRPGQRANPAGRPPGIMDARAVSVQAMARRLFTPEVWSAWAVALHEGTLPVPLAQTLLYYAYGKPQERIQVETVTDQPTDQLLARMRALVAAIEPAEPLDQAPADQQQ